MFSRELNGVKAQIGVLCCGKCLAKSNKLPIGFCLVTKSAAYNHDLVNIVGSTLPEIIMEVDGMAPWITMFYIELIIWNQF